MKKLSYCLLLLPLLLLLSGCSFDGASIHNDAVANHTDLSISYLEMVFGQVGNTLNSVSGQMLGKLFYKFNQGILCAAGLWLAYTIFTLLMQAVEGQFQQKKVHVILLRVALGVALIIPSPKTGYSAIQNILMKVVVEGVSLANMVWESGLTYMTSGGSVWHQPQAVAPGSNADFQKYFASIMFKQPSPSFTSTCALSGGSCTGSVESPPVTRWNQALQQHHIGSTIFLSDICTFSRSINSSSSSEYVPLSPSFSSDGTMFNFPSKSGSGDAGCGQIDLTKENSQPACPGSNTTEKTRCVVLQQAVQGMATDLMPAAKRYVCSTDTTHDICKAYPASSDLDSKIGSTMLSAFLNYLNTISPLKNLDNGKTFHETYWVGDAKAEGWAMAGRFYWDLARLQSQLNDSNMGAIQSAQPGTMIPPDEDLAKNIKPLANLYFQRDYKDTGSSLSLMMLYASKSLKAYGDTSKKGHTGRMNSNAEHGVRKSFMNTIGFLSMIEPFVGAVMDIVQLFGRFGNDAVVGGFTGDPILWLSGLGTNMMALSINLFVTVAGTSVMLAAIAAICRGKGYDGMSVLEMGMNWLSPLFWAAIAPLFVIGATYGYFVPILPYLVFTFGVIAWLIAVIEAMVAAPLVAFGLTHPDGHDFLGQTQQALMLGLSIFLRPSLMILGLIAGMITSYVSLRIALYSFNSFLTDLYSGYGGHGLGMGAAGLTPLTAATQAQSSMFSQSGSLGGWAPEILAITTIPMLLIVFTNIVYQIITKSFNLIHILPQYVGRWIGAPQDPALINSEEMVKGIEGSVEKGGKSVEQGLAHSTSNLKGSLSKILGQEGGGGGATLGDKP